MAYGFAQLLFIFNKLLIAFGEFRNIDMVTLKIRKI